MLTKIGIHHPVLDKSTMVKGSNGAKEKRKKIKRKMSGGKVDKINLQEENKERV